MKFSTFCSTISGEKKHASSRRVSARHRVQQSSGAAIVCEICEEENPAQGGG